jgi:hypothetical protein
MITGLPHLGMAEQVRNAALAPVFHDPGEFSVTTTEKSL